MPSRQGFTFLPSTSSPQSPQRGEEPGFPVGLELGCGSEPAFTGTDPGWARPRGVSFPTHPFPTSLILASQYKPSPAHPWGSASSPANPMTNQAAFQPANTGPWQLASSLIPSHGGLGFPCQHPSSAPGCGCWHRAHAQPSLPPGVSCHRALTVWKSLLLQSSLPNVQRTSISPRSSW